MATRRLASPPPAELDPERRESALSDIRLWVALRRLTDDDECMAWMVAWRRWDDALGPCPVAEGELWRAVAEYPDRSGYPAMLATWHAGRS